MVKRSSIPHPEEIAPTTRYLLCRGDQADCSRGIIDVFHTEKEARHELMRLHKDRFSRTSWAQVVALDPEGRLTILTWFGRASATPSHEAELFARTNRQPTLGPTTTARGEWF